jgi:putative sigma-54 modulation protein
MRLELTGRHLDITPTHRKLVDAKLARLERLLNDSAVSAQAVLLVERGRCRAELSLHARDERFLHSVGVGSNWEVTIGQAVDKMAQQAQRVKGKWKERKRHARPLEALVPLDGGDGRRPSRRSAPAGRARMPRIMKASRQAIKPMTVADAAREIDAGGDGLIVFRDAETSRINVLFRKGGELRLIETES